MARSNLRIAVGSYLGNGAAQTLNLGFRPDMFFVKGEGFNPPFRTRLMRGDTSLWLASANAGLANYVKDLTATGAALGTGTNVSSNGVRFYYVAIGSASVQNYFRVGRYYGDGVDNRNFNTGGLGFTPDLVVVKADGAQQPVFRISDLAGDLTSRLDAGSNSADEIQSLISGGFQLGAGARVNTSANEHHFFAAKKLAGAIATGTFTGNGAASRAITGLGFRPSMVVVKANAAVGPRILTTDMVTYAANSMFLTTTAADATGILSLDSDGFTVGSGSSVNGSAVVSTWWAFKAGSYNAPIVRTAI